MKTLLLVNYSAKSLVERVPRYFRGTKPDRVQ